MDWRIVPKTYDYLLALVVIGLGVFGVVMIYSSVFAESVPNWITIRDGGLHMRQITFIVSGAILMVAFSLIDYHYVTRFYLYIYVLMIVLLVVVRLFGAGDGVNRWILIPMPIIGAQSMQPSEFAKLFMTIFLAKFLDVHKERFNRPFWFGLVLLLIALPVLLVYLQPSFSASMVVMSISMVILFVGGLYWRTIFVSAAVLAPVCAMVWLDIQRDTPIFVTRVLDEWQWRRIESLVRPEYATPDARLQTEGSLYAIGTGGLTGRGFMENPYIILGNNDFIFSVAASQFGFVGAAILLAVMAFVIARCIFTALKAIDLEGRLIAAGVAGMLIFETFFHVGVATDILPNTGMPFPFLSYGGSMIWVHMIAMGMVLNVGLPRKPKSMFDQPVENSFNDL